MRDCVGIGGGRVIFYVTCFVVGAFGCSVSQPPSAPFAESSPLPTEKPPLTRPPLTADEERVAAGIRRHATHLSKEIGERNPQKLWELAEAADYLAAELEQLGYPLERQGYETDEVAAQNLSVTVQGGTRGDQMFIVGAHYDSQEGDSSGGSAETAALLELARLMRDARLTRTLRIVFFSMGEPPHGNGEARGARHFAREMLKLAQKKPPRGELDPATQFSRTELMGAVLLHATGPFVSRPKLEPEGAIFVHALTTPGAERITSAFSGAFDDPLRMVMRDLPLDGPESDATVFYGAGVPTVLLTGRPDREERGGEIDVEEIARFVMGFRYGVGKIVGEKPTNDAMVTPLLETSR